METVRKECAVLSCCGNSCSSNEQIHRVKEMGSMITQKTSVKLGYLMLSNKGFNSVDILRDWLLIPLNEGSLSPLDPCQKFF
jgi:hypothetical protein